MLLPIHDPHLHSSAKARGVQAIKTAASSHSHWLSSLSCSRGLQVIVYVEDVNDEVPVFTQRQYNRLGLRETAGIGTSVAVVRATDRDTGRVWLGCSPVGWAWCPASLGC